MSRNRNWTDISIMSRGMVLIAKFLHDAVWIFSGDVVLCTAKYRFSWLVVKLLQPLKSFLGWLNWIITMS